MERVWGCSRSCDLGPWRVRAIYRAAWSWCWTWRRTMLGLRRLALVRAGRSTWNQTDAVAYWAMACGEQWRGWEQSGERECLLRLRGTGALETAAVAAAAVVFAWFAVCAGRVEMRRSREQEGKGAYVCQASPLPPAHGDTICHVHSALLLLPPASSHSHGDLTCRRPVYPTAGDIAFSVGGWTWCMAYGSVHALPPTHAQSRA